VPQWNNSHGPHEISCARASCRRSFTTGRRCACPVDVSRKCPSSRSELSALQAHDRKLASTDVGRTYYDTSRRIVGEIERRAAGEPLSEAPAGSCA